MIINQNKICVALIAATASVLGFSSAAFSQEVPDFSSELEQLSTGTNSAAAIFIEDGVVSAAAAFGEAGAAAVATDETAVAVGSSYGGEIELEFEETDELQSIEETEIEVEFFLTENDDDDADEVDSES
mgnify:FL=1